MKNLRIYWGETLPVIVELDNPLALTATLTIGTDPQIIKTSSFVQTGEKEYSADVSIAAEDTEVTPGKYSYQLKVVYSNGDIKKFPDISACSDCSLPTVTILEALDTPEAS